MVLVTFAVVILRYVFSIGWVWLQESYVWMHGIVFMVGAVPLFVFLDVTLSDPYKVRSKAATLTQGVRQRRRWRSRHSKRRSLERC